MKIMYSPIEQKEFEKAIIFMVNKINNYCRNEKPVILHTLRVGMGLMELNMQKEVVIAGFLHDLLEDTDCQIEDIQKKFDKDIAKLVKACTFDISISNYKERWQKSLKGLFEGGKEAMIIRVVDAMDNLPYYILISDKNRKKEVLWKHRFLVNSLDKYLHHEKIFQKYQTQVIKAEADNG